jgi:hypothetical protein
MRPIPPEPFFKAFMLIKQDGIYCYPCGYDSNNGMGTGFFQTQNDAEMARTKELLGKNPESNARFHIYELELPNPAYKE